VSESSETGGKREKRKEKDTTDEGGKQTAGRTTSAKKGKENIERPNCRKRGCGVGDDPSTNKKRSKRKEKFEREQCPEVVKGKRRKELEGGKKNQGPTGT